MSRVNQNILPQKEKLMEPIKLQGRKKKSRIKFQILTTEYAQDKLHNFKLLQIHPASAHTVNISSLCHGLMAHWTELQLAIRAKNLSRIEVNELDVESRYRGSFGPSAAQNSLDKKKQKGPVEMN